MEAVDGFTLATARKEVRPMGKYDPLAAHLGSLEGEIGRAHV